MYCRLFSLLEQHLSPPPMGYICAIICHTEYFCPHIRAADEAAASGVRGAQFPGHRITVGRRIIAGTEPNDCRGAEKSSHNVTSKIIQYIYFHKTSGLNMWMQPQLFCTVLGHFLVSCAFSTIINWSWRAVPVQRKRAFNFKKKVFVNGCKNVKIWKLVLRKKFVL